jgi:hypothetical protein
MCGALAGRLAVAGLVAIGLAGCEALKDALPTKSSEPTPAPSQSPVAIPVVLPQPTPTPVLGGPTPAPSPSPSSTPAPSPTPTPGGGSPPTGGSCSLPPSSSPNAPCSMQTPNFLGAVDKAITQLTQQQPSIFDFGNKLCENCYYVNNEAAYVAGVIKNLNAAGMCAYYDGEELGVKSSNSFNEQYDILISSGHIRRGGGSYRSTCNPSWF